MLESFGNCVTQRNQNSSRFGKFVRLHYSSAGILSGGSVHRYLLEKSRVVTQEEAERSYHAFYQLCAGASPDERQRLKLPDDDATAAEAFRTLCPSPDYRGGEYNKIKEALAHHRNSPSRAARICSSTLAALREATKPCFVCRRAAGMRSHPNRLTFF